MAWSVHGTLTTLKAKTPSFWSWHFSGSAFVGPIAVVPNIYADNNNFGDNFGTMGVSDVKVSAASGNPSEPGALWPVSFTYHFTITNDSPNSLVYNVAIGTF